MRVNKYISSSGLCSRRAADKLVEEKRVVVNGEIAELGQHVSEGDEVLVDGEKVKHNNKDVYIILNKPRGITSTTEDHIEGNIVGFINHKERIFPIGRLDKDSEGLILLTNDGDIVNEILREENNNEKEYIVSVNKPITEFFLKGMREGVEIYNPVKNEYTVTKRCEVQKINNKTFKIILSQGLNRQIRRMCSAFDYNVVELKRIKLMDLTLEGLKVGEWRDLTLEEIKKIKMMSS